MPIILVGCKKDLRYDQKTIEELRKTSQKPVSPEEVCLAAMNRAPTPSQALVSCRSFVDLLYLSIISLYLQSILRRPFLDLLDCCQADSVACLG